MPALLRPYAESDAETVTRFFAASLARDPTLRPISLQEWRRFTARSFNDGARDFAVACDGERVVGLLMSALRDGRRNFRIIVDPRRRREGLGARLFDLAEEQGPADATLQSSCPSGWTVGMRFLERRGFRVVREDMDMSIEVPLPAAASPPLPPPIGVRLRPYAGAADDPAWSALNDAGYGGAPEHSTLTPADLEALRATERFHLWIAERDGLPVGFCHTCAWGGRSTVESLVVAPEERGHGLGRALLVRGMRTIAEQSPDRIHLNVRAENDSAVALYTAVGFRTDDTSRTYHRPVRARPRE